MEALLRRRGMASVAIVVATAAVYTRSLSGGFVSDDLVAVLENPLIRSLRPANLVAIATSFDDSNFIPLKVLSLALDHAVWGMAPAGFHATNVALHVANALLVRSVLLRSGESAGLALAAALVWALHPVQAESVAWIAERKNVLSTAFFLLAFFVYLGQPDRLRGWRAGAVALLFVAALLAKINTIVLPAILVVWDLATRGRVRRRTLALVAGLLVLGGAVAYVHVALNPSGLHGVAFHGGSFAVTLRSTFTVLPRYVALVVWPWDASTYHPVQLRGSWLEPVVAASVLATIAVAVVTVVLIRRRRRSGFWLAWVGITLSPMLNLVPFPAVMADRYLYVPTIGLVVVAARVVQALLGRVGWSSLALPLATAVVLALGLLTARRVPVWHDELSLWADWALRVPYVAADTPPATPPERREERRLLEAARAADPESAALQNNLGAIAYEEGRLGDAVAALERARAIDPTDRVVLLNLGRAYLWAGRDEDAATTLEAAAAADPLSLYAHLNLGRAYERLGDAVRSRAAIERAHVIRPDPAFWARVR